MGSKGSKDCCCGPCDIRSGCFLGGSIPDHCCSCVPKLVCIAAYDSGGYLLDVQPAEFECPGYTASLDCNAGPNIDIRILWRKNEEELTCEICMESSLIGHTKALEDLRLCQPMVSYDVTKKQGCSSPEYTWEVDAPVGCDVATIILSSDMFVSNPFTAIPLLDTGCVLFDRVCIIVNDGVNEWIQRVCLNGDGTWVFDATGDPTKKLFITPDPATLPVMLELAPSGWLGIDEPLINEAKCPLMEYTWRGTRTEESGDEYSWSVRVFGDRTHACKDCTCYCECLCITATRSDGGPSQQVVCESPYGGWDFEVDGVSGHLELVCLGCDTKITLLRLTSETHEVLGSADAGIICPDRLIADYSVELDAETTLGIKVQCNTCRDCPPLGVLTQCCDDLIPDVLYATLGGSGCGNLDGAVVRMIVNRTDSCWSGTVVVTLNEEECVVSLNLQCAGNGVWKLGNATTQCGTSSTHSATSTPCSPLILSFSVGPDGCCEGGITSDMTVDITE